ncbi:MAG: hypothetical protein APR63_14390 [Desulfuromonas sp. SDB]|nr:MAG: hypothetical protein APR63_14390 [Desulfuromonas sp. SDB]
MINFSKLIRTAVFAAGLIVIQVLPIHSQEMSYDSYEHSSEDIWRPQFYRALGYLQADEQDIHIPLSSSNFWLLKSVQKIMDSPLYSVDFLHYYADQLNSGDLHKIIETCISEYNLTVDYPLPEDNSLPGIFVLASTQLDYYSQEYSESLWNYTHDLLRHDDILEDLDPYQEYLNSLIYKDTVEIFKKLISEFDITPLFKSGLITLSLLSVELPDTHLTSCSYSECPVLYYLQTDYGPVIIGSRRSDCYKLSRGIIIDLGGDDCYYLDPSIKSVICIIDCQGDDRYFAQQDFAPAGSFLGVSVIIDSSGNDLYRGNYIALGSSILGISILQDLQGDDIYLGSVGSCGAGGYGLGLLMDHCGNDVYISQANSQGMAGVYGIGILWDSTGNDQYSCTGLYPDRLRFNQRYLSFGQGFSIGFRPELPGGFGILIDQGGNDNYAADVFAQGAAYWYGFGGILEGGGNDIYTASQYTQASGVHLAVGTILEIDGNDLYYSKSVSQGCGHDLAAGILIDQGGNDQYLAQDLAQGAGNANSWSIFIDAAGKDFYQVHNNSNTRGWSDIRRGYRGSSIFLDLRDQDQYIGPGQNNTIILRSTFGAFIDMEDSL